MTEQKEIGKKDKRKCKEEGKRRRIVMKEEM
jgi:hypothetical protein